MLKQWSRRTKVCMTLEETVSLPGSIKHPLEAHDHEFKEEPIGKVVWFAPSIHSHMDMNTEVVES